MRWPKQLEFFRLNEKQKKMLRKWLPGILSTVLLLTLVIWTVFHSTDGFTTLIDIEPATIVNEKESMTFEGYMLRNEMTVPSDYHGDVLYIADNAERINPGDTLAKVYSVKSDEGLQKKMDELDHHIALLEESIGKGTFTLGDSKNVQNGISQLYYDMMRATSNGDAEKVASGADELLTLLNKMKVYAGDQDKLKALLQSYRKQRAELENRYTGNYQTLTASAGGYFFRNTDGYEKIYSSENIKDMTYESFWNMTGQAPETTEAVGKILLDYRWYIVIPTVKGLSDSFRLGSNYTVSFPDSGNRTFPMTLDRLIYDDTEAKVLMVFQCGIVSDNFEGLRLQQINIVSRDVTGFRIPISAVCEQNGNTGVFILKDGKASFRKTVILYEGDGYYVVSAQNVNSDDFYVYLEVNDSIITDCRNMYEGKVLA